ncbi:FecR family protein [Carboxylicivirga sp. N1Y90]|uniref:FecR family protein n=1 Tax=Carboxylicivirga fragile TaxID=3417571 RepID=UPI003D3332C2|nr:DUF4974 domain-containing protein [Marinilabiliaceae bacterium N1Y90]
MPVKIEIESKTLWKVYKDTASVDELKQFNQWLKTSDQNKLYFDLFCEKIEAERQELDNSEIEKSWKQIYYSIAVKKRFNSILKYAAAITLPLILGLSIFYLNNTSQTKTTAHNEILPGVRKATLFLSDGSTIALDVNDSDIVFKENGQVVGKDSLSTLEYIDVGTNELIYNTIKIPYGGEYNLRLSDGTIVWLNAGSELRYPVNFIGNKREVFIKGEGFFDVAHIVSSPFLVHTDYSTVKVYGTEFNVMSYSDDKIEQVTLVDGKVGININGKQTLLKPGEQAEVTPHSSVVAVKKVDTELYTAWTGGELIFENMPLNELAKKLARWYKVDFFFANDGVSQKRFTGIIDKNNDFEFFMSLIEKTTNVKIIVNGRTVLVKEQI